MATTGPLLATFETGTWATLAPMEKTAAEHAPLLQAAPISLGLISTEEPAG